MTSEDIVIVGGGLSGLYSQYLLQKRGIKTTLYEARSRLGGRILSLSSKNEVTPNQDPVRYDMGPSWFWPDFNPLISQLVAEFGLTAFEQYQSGAHLFDRGPSQAPQPYALGLQASPLSMRLAGGMGSLVDAIAQRAQADTIHTNHSLVRIEQDSEQLLKLWFRHSEREFMVTANSVILALPLRLMAHDIEFQPPLSQKMLDHCRQTMTWMAAHAKFVAIYDKTFWRDKGLAGSASSQFGPLVEIHDAAVPDDRAALFGFVGMPAPARKQLGEKALISKILQQLSHLFGAEASIPLDTFFIDWSQEPYTATEQDQLATAGHPIYGLPTDIATHFNGSLIFSGTETDAQTGGYLEGALASAVNAVKAITE